MTKHQTAFTKIAAMTYADVQSRGLFGGLGLSGVVLKVMHNKAGKGTISGGNLVRAVCEERKESIDDLLAVIG
jgi:hypothetical protein